MSVPSSDNAGASAPTPAAAPSGSSGSPSPSTGSSGSSASTSAASSLAKVSSQLGAAPSSAQPGDPASGGSAPAPTAPATGGVADPATGQPAPARGPIPYDRHEAALRNAREEARSQAEAQYSWLREQGLDHEEAKRRLGIAARLFQDPRAFIQQLQSELNPEPEWTDPEDPEPDLRDLQGNPAGYSPKQLQTLIKNALARERREWEQQFGPVQQFVGQLQEEQARTQVTQQAQQTVQAVLGELRADPEFQKHEREVLGMYMQMDAARQKYGAIATLHAAWNKFYRERIVPTLGQTAQAQVLTDLQKSATAGAQGSPKPVPAAPTAPKLREGNLDDLATHMANKFGAMSAT